MWGLMWLVLAGLYIIALHLPLRSKKKTQSSWSLTKRCAAWWIWYMWSGWTSAGRRDWTDDIVFFFCNHWWEITYRKKNPQFINYTISKVIQLKLNLMSSELKKNLHFSVIDHHSLKRSCDPRVITTETCEYSRDFIVTRLSRLAPRSV